ncbi:MAG TPA: AraC family transcriptional regulator [Flavisolibacter sp.]|jgi:AraC-like DNA-binding protein|nr:AraC family transcriptional regulator [Flavisolibacter sp.]
MIFEFTASKDFDFITDFSEKFKFPVSDGLLSFPRSIGEGFVRKIAFSTDFRILMHRYKLKEDFIIIRNPTKVPNDLISIFFYNNEQPIDLVYNEETTVKFSRKNESAIQVTTNDLNSIIRFPANIETHYVVIGITSQKLAALLNIKKPNRLIETVTSGTASFLYFESMQAETQHILKHIFSVNADETLGSFSIQIKVQELLFHLFNTLIKRENTTHKHINNDDAERLMALRNIILSDLSVPPSLPALAAMIGMSETKMKQLFKQTFGSSIYNYFQKVRMEEAAFLLKQGGYSVSQVGFELGFTNLSHFSRLFESHYGTTPKKFSAVV